MTIAQATARPAPCCPPDRRAIGDRLGHAGTQQVVGLSRLSWDRGVPSHTLDGVSETNIRAPSCTVAGPWNPGVNPKVGQPLVQRDPLA